MLSPNFLLSDPQFPSWVPQSTPQACSVLPVTESPHPIPSATGFPAFLGRQSPMAMPCLPGRTRLLDPHTRGECDPFRRRSRCGWIWSIRRRKRTYNLAETSCQCWGSSEERQQHREEQDAGAGERLEQRKGVKLMKSIWRCK